ncbi:PREDICTED: uncharacterized protein LOC106747862 [Dinoponera quadriceps]|uniref:Uncharacterized protein LOC106747862 n=1 Tax=Dinoponera quadriceps TaxID=609295 RepID=A0A6P3XTU0_DINQU|nr:PREDICTED: uncharacterized protein LOC106747862 [Dinoponera quadriceps]XP_014481313.1 PREDICTED: uncharacterized protein LOC106747862 [Dinoponera quadriceps]
MTSFGRGRGWFLQKKEQGLRRPGGVFCTNDAVKDILNKLSTNGTCEQISPQLVQEIIDVMTNASSKENLRETCDMLWKQSVMNDTFTMKMAMVFSDNKVALIEDTNKETIRSRFLRFLQDNYMSREKNKMEDKKTFANIVLLHAEVYYHMRLNNGSRLKILALPLIHYLGDLIEDSVEEESIHFIMIQILRSGKNLYTACPEQLVEFIIKIKQALIKEKSEHSRNRAMLLLVIDLANNHYEIKDTRLRQLYTSNIKTLIFEYPFFKKELEADTETKIGNVLGNDLPKNMQEVDNVPPHRIAKEEMNDLCNKQSHHSKGHHVPRAIRGTGALDTKKEDDVNTKLNSMKITSPRQKNADFWDHDDRFHKDYE